MASVGLVRAPASLLSALGVGLAALLGLGCAEQAKSPQACGAEMRPQLDCQSEFSYDATQLKGSFSLLNVGGASAESDTKALRQIDTETQQYIVQARRLCDEYNKCVLDRAAYASESENLRRRLAKLPDLYNGLRDAKDDADRSKALSNAYEAVVPDERRVELGMDFSVFAQRPGESSPRVLASNESLPTDTRIRFNIGVSRGAYVYLFQRSPTGAIVTLFPDPRIGVPNPLQAGQRVEIPGSGHSFRLNEKDLGNESVFVVASLSPVSALDATVDSLAQGGTSDSTLTSLSTIGPGDAGSPNCKTRALELSGDTPSCVRSRGLDLDDGTGPAASNTSLRAKTEAGDSVIVKVFAFRHTGA